MRVLLDEDLPQRLRHFIPNHDVFTVRYAGWAGLKNGVLLRTAEADGVDVFVTGDQKMMDQQNMKGRKIAVVVLTAQKMIELQRHLAEIASAVDRALPGTIQFVECV